MVSTTPRSVEMKKLSKLIALVLSLCVALSLVAGCGNGESVGEIKGNYQEVEKVSAEDLAKANTALMAATNEDSEKIGVSGANAKLGVSLKSNVDLKVGSEFTDENNKTVKENVSVNGNVEMGLSASSNEEGDLASLAAMLKVSGKASLPNSLFEENGTGNREISASEELYVDAAAGLKDAYIYLNTDIKGLPEKAEGETDPLDMILGKKKVSIVNLIGAIIGGKLPIEMPELPEIDLSEILPATGLTVTDVQNVLTMVDMKLSLDCSDGVKFKISTTDTTKDKIKALLTTGLKAPNLSSLKIDKLNVNFYLQLDAEGHLVATAASAEVKVEVPAELTKGTKLNIEGNVSFSLSIGEVEVKLPDGIATDESYEELFVPEVDDSTDAGAGE